MAKKDKEADDLEQKPELDFDDLDDVSVKVTITKVGGGGKVFPVKLAEVLKDKFDRDGSFAVPKDWLESKTGYNTDKPMKGRPNAYKRKLNRQHSDLAGEGHIWHIGNSDDAYYTIAILEATPAEVEKWQKPKPKKVEDDE